MSNDQPVWAPEILFFCVVDSSMKIGRVGCAVDSKNSLEKQADRGEYSTKCLWHYAQSGDK